MAAVQVDGFRQPDVFVNPAGLFIDYKIMPKRGAPMTDEDDYLFINFI